MVLLNTVLEAQRIEKETLLRHPWVQRQRISTVSKALSSPLVKVITGPRRSGKSTLAFQVLAKTSFAYVNFEDDSLPSNFSSDDLLDAIQTVYGKTDFLFFDEIQNFPNWDTFVNKLHRRGHNVLITGSNSKLLSRELSTALTGRHVSFELLPFSFQEFLQGIGQTNTLSEKQAKRAIKNVDERYLFHQFLTWGGFPEVVLGALEPNQYLRTLFDSIILQDIVKRHRIRAATAIYDLLSLLMNNASNRFSARSIERSLGTLSVATIQKFIVYCREAYLVQDLQPFHFKPRLRIKSDRKIYAYDNGFVSAVSQPSTSNNARLLENLVFIELVRRGFVPNRDLFYYQTKSNTEVDFLLSKGAKNLELIQVATHLSSLKTRERETRALFQAADELGVKNLTIVTLNAEQTIQHQNRKIRVIPCRKWCA